MKAGFRGWLYRMISAVSGFTGVLVCLTLVELSRLYGFPGLIPGAGIGLALSFLILMTALVGEWTWRRYMILSIIFATLMGVPYLVLRPEMLRDDVLKSLVNPPLTVDLVFYRSIALRNDAERDLKIERLGFIYGFVNTYGANQRVPTPGGNTPIPEAK